MTLQDCSNLAQVIGAIAVVISLFYVGFQIKRNTSAVRSATAQAIHNNYGDWYMNLMRDAELNRIGIKGLRDYSSLDEIEKARFIDTLMAFISFSQNAFYQWREKALSPWLWGGWEILVMNLFAAPGGKRVLEGAKLRFRKGILGVCGEGHFDEEATSRSQALWRFQDRRMIPPRICR
jgi:hypothetical protein